MSKSPLHKPSLGQERRVSTKIGAIELVKKGGSKRDLRDPYQLALTVRWRTFFAGMVLVYLAINLAFATLYRLQTGSIANGGDSFLNDFFFSVETMDTVGYGEMAPATLYAHAVSVVEALVGLVFAAVITGMVFVRFSRPKANIVFADDAVVNGPPGHRALHLRIANARSTLLVDGTVKLYGMVVGRHDGMEPSRRVFELKLENGHLPVFALAWILTHHIDEHSPLVDGLLEDADVQLLLLVTALDVVTGTAVTAAREYTPGRIRPNMRYADSVTRTGERQLHVDLGRIGLIEPDPDATPPAP